MRMIMLALAMTGTVAQAQFAPAPRVPTPRTPSPFGAPALPSGPSIGREAHDIRERIDDGRRSDQLSRRDSNGLKRQASGIDLRAGIYAGDGLSDAEQRELTVRAQVLRDATIARRSGVGGTRR